MSKFSKPDASVPNPHANDDEKLRLLRRIMFGDIYNLQLSDSDSECERIVRSCSLPDISITWDRCASRSWPVSAFLYELGFRDGRAVSPYAGQLPQYSNLPLSQRLSITKKASTLPS